MEPYNIYDEYGGAPRDPLGFCILALFIGALGLVVYFSMPDFNYISLGLGAVGLVIGAYALSYSNRVGGDRKLVHLIISGIGLVLSMISFMFGFASL
ncbi:MAG: hypothetical protein LBV63_00165 [Candidatus Methanoplasma sp.]|jgi:hypothetical protein|nr:hypothetical protein [Candidatus Methanoplasma sp.]